MSHTVVIIHDPDPDIVATAVTTITQAVGECPLTVHTVTVEDAGDVDTAIEKLLLAYGLNENERAQVWLDEQGFSRTQIADRLGLSRGSVTVYWKYVYDKIGVPDRPALREWLKTLRRNIAGSTTSRD